MLLISCDYGLFFWPCLYVSLKVRAQLCTWWPLMTPAWVWVPVKSKMLYLCTGAQKYFLKICAWWTLVTLTWFWPQILSKMLLLCIGAQKYSLKICTWWPLVTLTWFGVTMMFKICFLCILELRNTLYENLYLKTFGDLPWFQTHWNYFWVAPLTLYCPQNSQNFEVLRDFYLQVGLSACSRTYTPKINW